jgi:hypothetical protein
MQMISLRVRKRAHHDASGSRDRRRGRRTPSGGVELAAAQTHEIALGLELALELVELLAPAVHERELVGDVRRDLGEDLPATLARRVALVPLGAQRSSSSRRSTSASP